MTVKLDWIHKDGMILTLLEDMSVNSSIIVKRGFTTDGATIPKFLWSILSPFENYFPACVIHDYLCDIALLADNISDIYKLRKNADETFNEVMQNESIKTSTRLALYCGVTTWRWIRYNKLSVKLFKLPSIDVYNEDYFKSLGFIKG